MYICLITYCTLLLTPHPNHCTYHLGEATKAATDKMIDTIINKGAAFSVCGSEEFVKSSELYKQWKKEK